jgi:hypothetical protein
LRDRANSNKSNSGDTNDSEHRVFDQFTYRSDTNRLRKSAVEKILKANDKGKPKSTGKKMFL